MLQDFFKNFKKPNQEVKAKNQKQIDMFKIINNILKQGDSLFTFAQPNIFSLSQENNIAQKYNDEIIVTNDKNLCIGFKLFGHSYASITPEEELNLCESRNKFFTCLDNDLELNIVCKKEKIMLDYVKADIKNPYAKEIIDKWENLREAYQIVYYLIISTKTKAVLGELNKFKDKMTKEKNTEGEDEDESEETPNIITLSQTSSLQKQASAIHYGLDIKAQRLSEVKESVIGFLGQFQPKVLDSNELINFFATY